MKQESRTSTASETTETTCSCCAAPGSSHRLDSRANPGRIIFNVVLCTGGLVIWWLAYSQLAMCSQWLTYSVLTFEQNTHLGASVEFFVFESPKVLMLLVLVVFGVGIVRTFFTPARTRRILSGKRESVGNVLAAMLGIVTPFCSCSAVPLFIGFVTTGVPLGVTFSFLISAPMVNEVALVLLFGIFGWKVAGLYLFTGLVIAIIAGWVIGRLGMEKHVEDWVFETTAGIGAEEESLDWTARFRLGWAAVKEIVGQVWLYVLIGIAVGAGIHGFVPENFIASIMGKGAWWSVPLAVILGVPMYSNAAGLFQLCRHCWARVPRWELCWPL